MEAIAELEGPRVRVPQTDAQRLRCAREMIPSSSDLLRYRIGRALMTGDAALLRDLEGKLRELDLLTPTRCKRLLEPMCNALDAISDVESNRKHQLFHLSYALLVREFLQRYWLTSTPESNARLLQGIGRVIVLWNQHITDVRNTMFGNASSVLLNFFVSVPFLRTVLPQQDNLRNYRYIIDYASHDATDRIKVNMHGSVLDSYRRQIMAVTELELLIPAPVVKSPASVSVEQQTFNPPSSHESASGMEVLAMAARVHDKMGDEQPRKRATLIPRRDRAPEPPAETPQVPSLLYQLHGVASFVESARRRFGADFPACDDVSSLRILVVQSLMCAAELCGASSDRSAVELSTMSAIVRDVMQSNADATFAPGFAASTSLDRLELLFTSASRALTTMARFMAQCDRVDVLQLCFVTLRQSFWEHSSDELTRLDVECAAIGRHTVTELVRTLDVVV